MELQGSWSSSSASTEESPVKTEEDETSLGTLHASDTGMLAVRPARHVRSCREQRQELKELKATHRKCSMNLPKVALQIESGMQHITVRCRVLQARLAALQIDRSELEEIRISHASEQHWIDSSFQQVAKQRDEADNRATWLMDRLVQLLDLKSPDQVSGHIGDVFVHLENGERCRSEQLQCLRGQLEAVRSENCQKAIQLTNELYRSKQLRTNAHKLLGDLLTSGVFSCIADHYGRDCLTPPQPPAVPVVTPHRLPSDEQKADTLQTTVDRVEEHVGRLEAVYQSLCVFEETQGHTHQSSPIPTCVNKSPTTSYQALAAMPTNTSSGGDDSKDGQATSVASQPQPDAGAGPDVQGPLGAAAAAITQRLEEPVAPCPEASATGGDETKKLLPLELRMREVLEAAMFSDVVVRMDDGIYQFGDLVRARLRIGNSNQVVASTDGITEEQFEALVSRMKTPDHEQPRATIEHTAVQSKEIAVHSPLPSMRRIPFLQAGSRQAARCHSSDRLVQNRVGSRQGLPSTDIRPPRTSIATSGSPRASSPRASSPRASSPRALSRSCSPSRMASASTTAAGCSARFRHVPTGDAAAGLEQSTHATLEKRTLAATGSPRTPTPTKPSRTPDRQSRPAIAGGHTSFGRQRQAVTGVAATLQATLQRPLSQQRRSSPGRLQEKAARDVATCVAAPRRQVSSRLPGSPFESNPITQNVSKPRRTLSSSPSRTRPTVPVAAQHLRLQRRKP